MEPYRIKSIKDYHQILGMPNPEHPLISVINLKEFNPPAGNQKVKVIFDFYIISLKRSVNGKIRYGYGQQHYDFDAGMLFFISPGQVFSVEADDDFTTTGWMLLIHPDFLWNMPLAKTIKQYGYFDYAVNEALFVSEKEEATIIAIIDNIEREYHTTIDKFSHTIIISQLESLLSYSERFYQRQFITRRIAHHQVLERLEALLATYFNSDDLAKQGLPSVQYIADALHLSPNYLSALLKTLTGKSTQQHIQDKLIEKAKEKLSTTDLGISEIAYALGFEYPQSFGKLFKSKTNLSPLAFRQSFN